jgi:hemoglobin
VNDLVATLDKFKVPAREKDDLLALLGTLKGDILERPYRLDRPHAL